MLRLAAITAVVALAIAAGVQAQPDRTAACPAPKPLPASVKKPSKGASATQLANFLLALPQRKPCDVSLFTSKYIVGNTIIPGFYPEGSPLVPAPGPPPDEAAVRGQLGVFLKGQFAGNPARANAVLARFDRTALKERFPDPTLRAAFVSLRGTVAEGVDDYFLSRLDSLPPRFGGVSVPTAIAQSATNGDKRQIFFNSRYQGENFALFVGIVPHEILHHDNLKTATEEAILNALTAIVHMQLLSRHPGLATSGTELSRQLNDEVIALVNSRALGSSRSAIVAPNGRGLAPGSSNEVARNAPDLLTAFARSLENAYGYSRAPTTPAPEALRGALTAILAPAVKIPKPLTYSKKTALLFSRLNDTWLSPVDRLRVSVLLGLVSMEEITAYTGLSRVKAVSMFRLAPILAAMK
jgi:hypothetical protein